LAEAAMEKVRSGETVIMPERERKRFFQWMENIRDWCISRQLWWGHRIPIWYCEDCLEEICPLPHVNEVKKCPKCGNNRVSQDEDVLDTWFQRYYPNTTRETGYDILFFWVAREMMLGVELTGKAPYKNVYLHGMIRDDKGRKISKSMEDVEKYDPLLIIEEFGADALRWLLISNTLPGMDMNLDPRQLTAAHRFFNKIWQSVRFTMYHVQDSDQLPELSTITKDLQLPDQWILSRLNRLVKSVNKSMQNFDYLEAARMIKSFYWYEFCDWYIEMSKIRLYKKAKKAQIVPKVVLLHIIDTCLRLLHPFIPFMTEKLWLNIPFSSKLSPALIVAKWPKTNDFLINSGSEEKMTFTFDLVREIRRIRSEFGVGLAVEVPLLIGFSNDENSSTFESTKKEIISLAKIDSKKLTVSNKSDIGQPEVAAKIVLPGIEAFIPLEAIIDLEKERNRINGQLNKVNKEITQITAKLNSPFAQRAPPEIVEKAKEDLDELGSKKSHLTEQLEILNKNGKNRK
jgi:valyl-tRNA synthetase